jgi:hypothetical protein
MITSKSPRRVLKLAYTLRLEVLPRYFSPFSRHGFTKPQLFACLGAIGTGTYFPAAFEGREIGDRPEVPSRGLGQFHLGKR